MSVGAPPSRTVLQSPDNPGPTYDRAPEHADIARDIDICSSKTVLHKLHHDRAHPSHLLLPIISQ
jgi:hypothetical protein